MRIANTPEEFRIYAAEGKQLVLRYHAADLAASDRDCESLKLSIDVSGCGIGPYRRTHPYVAIRIDRRDCENILAHLARAGDPGHGELTLVGDGGVGLTMRPGVERWTRPRPYTELMFEGLELWREFAHSRAPDYRLYVWLYPEMVARLVEVLRDLLRPPELRRVALPAPKQTSVELDPVEYAMGS